MGSIKIPQFLIVIGVIFIAAYIKLQIDLTHFKLAWLYPYALLWTGYREENLAAWLKYAKVNRDITFHPSPVPEIQAEDFSYESFRSATHNFRYPAVVRGLFANTTAVQKWTDLDYMHSKLGEYLIPVVRNGVVGTMQDDRELYAFSDAFRKLLTQDYAKEYMFFPVKSRFSFNGSAEGSAQQLQDAVNALCREDLDVDRRLWRGFSGKTHTNFLAYQMIIGKSTAEFSKQSTGSDWHCAGGNNWFIQVAGSKYWEFIEPRYSPYMAPLKGGAFNMWTGNKNMADIQAHIPRRSVTLRTGDMLYNPDWTWHKIINHGGLSIGVPAREVNGTYLFQNNMYFSLIAFTNKILTSMVGISLAGYPPPTAATEADNV